MKNTQTKNYRRKFMLMTLSLFASIIILAQANFAQSSDPDNPTVLNENEINRSNSGNLSDDKTYYYAFNVSKGTLTWTLDLTPTNKSDAGGVLEWTMLTPKFQKLKSDVLSAQGSPQRQMKDMPVTIKRRIILKIVVSGNVNYKIKLTGSAFNP